MKKRLVFAALAFASLPVMAFAADDEPQQGADVSELVITAPAAAGDGVAASKLGFTVHTVTPQDFEHTSTLFLGDTLQRRVPGVNVVDVQGNPMTGDVNFRGFSASALQGVPQGLAVYLNGQRLNEAFGDTLNWDLIPQVAVSRADVFTNNPAFGLNALGGALALTMKNGETYDGGSLWAEGGGHGIFNGSLERAWRNESLNLYFAVDGGQDQGWRRHSASNATRGYADFGFKIGGGDVHLTALAARSSLGVVGPSPVDLLEIDRETVYTYPQVNENDVLALAVNGSWPLGDTWSVQGGLRMRRFDQAGVDGNDAEFERCSGNALNPLFGTLCLEDDDFDPLGLPDEAFQIVGPSGAAIPCPAPLATGCNTTAYGTLDRSWTTSNTRGASVQFSNKGPLFGRENRLAIGFEYEDADMAFSSTSTLGIITPDLEVVTGGGAPGAGQVIQARGAIGYGPADYGADSQRTGVYFTDTMDLSDRLFLTIGGRYNREDIDTLDKTGLYPELTASHKFSRFNPALSLAYKATDAITLFGGYSETNRAPTPLELGCSDPLRPCLLANSLVADPPLEQVVSRTFELGARGRLAVMDSSVRWSAAVFDTRNEDDIISIASSLPGRGYFANVEGTVRRGLEAEIDYYADRWSAYAGYSYIEAKYDFTGQVASPNNPSSDADGLILIEKADRLGGVPAHRLKAGGDFKITDRLSIGADAIYVGEQYFVGDEGNENDKLESYWLANARLDYALNERASFYARVTNLFDEEYASFGTYFEADGIANVTPNPLPASPDDATVTPGAPRTFTVGLRLRFR